MKFKYQFANEAVDVEIDEKWGAILLDLDRREYNNGQTETRRHALLSAMDYEGEAFIDPSADVEWLAALNIRAEALHAAIKQLKPKQRELIYALYLCKHPVSQAEYAKTHGISEASINQNAWRARTRLMEILSSKNLSKKL
ncbi:MAG: sigma factor-like helix-turn-helix DNA-binding protein [Clostridiaceae bacterium]